MLYYEEGGQNLNPNKVKFNLPERKYGNSMKESPAQ